MVVPAFSVGRSQDILFRLRQLEEDGRVPRLPVFLDSPMSIEATGLYRKHAEEHDAEMRSLQEAGVSPFRPAHLHLTRTVEESKAINHVEPPAIVLSASGMASGGRVVHHLKRRLPFPQNLVAFVGYQAEGTLGRSLVDGATRVHIHGDEVAGQGRSGDARRVLRPRRPGGVGPLGEGGGPGADRPGSRRGRGQAGPGRGAGRVFSGEVLLPARGDTLEV